MNQNNQADKILAIGRRETLEKMLEYKGSEVLKPLPESEAGDYAGLKLVASDGIGNILIEENVAPEVRRNAEEVARELNLHYLFFTFVELIPTKIIYMGDIHS